MMKYAHLHTLFLIFVFCISCKGQNKTDLPRDTIESLTDIVTSYGPNRMVRNIKKDRNGSILIAASVAGVFRYDGKSFTNLTSKMGSPRFMDVLEDRRGNLWFSSTYSGVYYYDGKSFRNFTTIDGLADNQVSDIYEDKTGNIWFGTPGGASRYDGKSFRNYKMGELPDGNVYSKDHNAVNSIIEDNAGKFWFGTGGNACVYDGKTFTILTHDGKPFKNVRCIIEDKKGNIWLGGATGLWRFDGTAFVNFTENFTGYIYEDKNGNIWTSSERANDGRWVLSRYDEKSLSNKKPGVTEINPKFEGNSGMLFGILEADDGSIWFGALDGVYRYDGNTITDFKDKEIQK